MRRQFALGTNIGGFFEQSIRADRRIGAGIVELCGIARIGAGAHAEDNIAQPDIRGKRPGGADADDIFHAEETIQLIGINADGGHAHAARHHADGHAVIGAGVALHTAHVVDKVRVFQKVFRNEFGAQRVARH